MRTWVYLALVTTASALGVTTLEVNRPIQADGITHYLEPISTPSGVARSLDRSNWGVGGFGQNPGDILDPLPRPPDFDLPLPIPGPIGGNDTLVMIEQIINLGERVWKFVADNKPVINIKRNYANALPKGVRTSEDLDGWSSLQYRSFRMYGKNGFNKIPYDVTFTLVHRYRGNYDGRGQYLENATVLPHKVDVLWGYTVDAGVENVGAVNVGTKDSPVGGLVMELSFRVSTIIKATEFRSVYEFRGDRAEVSTIRDEKPGVID